MGGSVFEDTGRFWLRNAMTAREREALAVEPVINGRMSADHPVLQSGQTWLRELATLWPGMRPVRAVAFDKQTQDNWAVPWHQDRIIAVAERKDVPEFEQWSLKRGVWHCAPPVAILERMLFVRLHLDGCDADSGAMEVALGSHRLGAVAAGDAAGLAEACATEISQASPGDIQVLHMLMLHRSRPSRVAAPRRVLRVDLADFELPGGLRWAVDGAEPTGTTTQGGTDWHRPA